MSVISGSSGEPVYPSAARSAAVASAKTRGCNCAELWVTIRDADMRPVPEDRDLRARAWIIDVQHDDGCPLAPRRRRRR